MHRVRFTTVTGQTVYIYATHVVAIVDGAKKNQIDAHTTYIHTTVDTIFHVKGDVDDVDQALVGKVKE